MREGNVLTGAYGVHVDDCATGGSGPKYDQALTKLRTEFEFRKWRTGQGDFCGARYTQDPATKEIVMDQTKFAQEKLRPLRLSRQRSVQKSDQLTPAEVSCLRAINGGLNWLATQSRPDLSAQVSFSQQSFPSPTVEDALFANNAIRRARQHSDLTIVYRSIPPGELGIMCHSDAAYANAKAGATQAGYVVSFTNQNMDQGADCPWTPAFWKSFRLPRVVNSTLSAEAQAMSVASSMAEWTLLLLNEAMDGPQFPHTFWQATSQRLVIVVTDCKSLYDHIRSPSSPTLEDKRTSIDIIILRDSLGRMCASLRWIPTDRMLADAMTKESADATDLLRGCIRAGRYQISPEEKVLTWRAQERDRRKQVAFTRAASAKASCRGDL